MKPVFYKITFIIVLLSGIFFTASAQFDSVFIGVNGLTCSQCTRSVEMKIRKLDFVSNVDMNLEHTEGKIILKKNSKPDMDKIAQAVIDAGFSVRYLSANLTLDRSATQSGSCINYQGDEYVFTQAPIEPMKGTIKIKFIGKKFLPKNEFKKMEALMDKKCGEASGKVYHVAI